MFLLQFLELLSLLLGHFHLTRKHGQLLHVSPMLFPHPPRLPLIFGSHVSLPHLLKHLVLLLLRPQQLLPQLHQGPLFSVQLLLPTPTLSSLQFFTALPENGCMHDFNHIDTLTANFTKYQTLNDIQNNKPLNKNLIHYKVSPKARTA